MGFVFPFAKKERLSDFVRTEVVVKLTQLGMQKADQMAGEGPKFEVLATLRENGPSSISELAEETRLDAIKVRHILKSLAKAGYVARAGEGG